MDLSTLTEPPVLYIVIAVAVVIVGLVVWGVVARLRRRRERDELRQRYGAEYDRTVRSHGSTKAAVADLKEREELHSELELRDLGDADKDLVRRHMAAAQYRFVEDPADVMLQTQRVVEEVLRAKGYPVAEDRDRALRLLSVDHPELAGPVRTVLEGRHDGDVARMRETFLDARHALHEMTGISYVLGDATDRPDDLRADEERPDHASHSG